MSTQWLADGGGCMIDVMERALAVRRVNAPWALLVALFWALDQSFRFVDDLSAW